MYVYTHDQPSSTGTKHRAGAKEQTFRQEMLANPRIASHIRLVISIMFAVIEHSQPN